MIVAAIALVTLSSISSTPGEGYCPVEPARAAHIIDYYWAAKRLSDNPHGDLPSVLRLLEENLRGLPASCDTKALRIRLSDLIEKAEKKQFVPVASVIGKNEFRIQVYSAIGIPPAQGVEIKPYIR